MTSKPGCDCEADSHSTSTVIPSVRGTIVNGKVVWREKRAQQIRHYRERDDAYFWHWSDTKNLVRQ